MNLNTSLLINAGYLDNMTIMTANAVGHAFNARLEQLEQQENDATLEVHAEDSDYEPGKKIPNSDQKNKKKEKEIKKQGIDITKARKPYNVPEADIHKLDTHQAAAAVENEEPERGDPGYRQENQRGNHDYRNERYDSNERGNERGNE